MSASNYNHLFSQNIQKKIHIRFTDNGQSYDLTNDSIVTESFSLEEHMFSEENMRFGACESSCLKMQIVNDIELTNKWIDVYIGYTDESGRIIDSNGNKIVDEDGNYLIYNNSNASGAEYYVGHFIVISDKPVNDRSWRDIVAYDAMYVVLNTDVTAWYENLTFPITIKNLTSSLFEQFRDVGPVRWNSNDLVNKDLVIPEKAFAVDGQLSAKDVLTAILELNGAFCHVAYDPVEENKRMFAFFSGSQGRTYEPSWYIDGSGSYEDYEVEQITGIIVRDSEDDVGTTVGTLTNPYVIENNPLVYGLEGTPELQAALQNTLTSMQQLVYRPFEVETYGNPYVRLGDYITLRTHNQTIHSYVFNRTLSGVQSMKDHYSATGKKYLPSKTNSMASQIQRTKGKVHILRNDVDGLLSEVYDTSTGILSQISQLASEIVLKVDNNGDMVEVALSSDPSTGSTFQVSADNIDFVANDVMQFTTGVLGINSDNFTIDKTTGAVAIDGSITAESGSIGGFTISSTTNQGTSAQGGHYYKNSLYTHITDSANGYEYEIGLQGGGTSPTSIAFYVYRIAQGAAWSTATSMFKVLKNGTVDLAGSINADSLKVVDKIQLRSAQISNYNFVQNYYSAEDWGAYINNTAGSHAIRIVGYSAGEWDGYMGALIGKWKIGNYDIAYKTTSGNISSYWGIIPVVGSSDGVMEIGRYLDFHRTSSNVADFTFRLDNSADGTLAASGTITQGSSRKIKENIEEIPIEEAEKILELNPVRFDYIKGAKDRRGFIAEEVEEVLPNLVTPEEEDIPASLDYNGIIPYLVKMVQKQQEEINELKRRLEDG